MNIKAVKSNYLNMKLSKHEFIDKMKEFHDILFDFSYNLKDTEIEKIEIQDDQVIMTSRETDYHRGGLKFIVDSQDKRTVSLEAFNFNTYEKEDSEMLFNLIDSDNIIFDIGANVGWYSIHIANILKKGVVYCFEPIPETYNKLQNNIAVNNLTNIQPIQLALSEKTQTLSFFYSPKQTGASSYRNITENENAIHLELKSISLDEFVEEKNIQKIDLIKCDVEGAELFVYQGGLKSIEKYKPIVFTEMLRKWAAKFGYHPNDIVEIFTKMSYDMFYVENKKFNKIVTITDDTIQTNFFLLHRGKHMNIIKKYLSETL
jgi:FkbM family methyltransferase